MSTQNDILYKTFYEKLIKDGRFTFAVTAWENRDTAPDQSLIVRWTGDLPMLYMKRDGAYYPAGTETDLNFNKFILNFLEVSPTRQKEDVDPSIWFKTFKDSSNSEGYSDENIKMAYQYIEQNLPSMSPYIQKVAVDSKEHYVIPMIISKMVFYDLAKLIANEKIRSLDEVFPLLIQYMQKVRTDNQAQITAVNKAITEVQTDIRDQNNRQDENIELLSKESQEQTSSNSALLEKIDTFIKKTEFRNRSKRFSIEGSATYAYPVAITIGNGNNQLSNGYECFNAPTYIMTDDGNRLNIVQLGGSSTVYVSNVPYQLDDTYIMTQKCNGSSTTPIIYDIKRVSYNTWVLLIKGGSSFTVYSKYIDDIQVDTSTDSKFDINPIANIPSVVINKLLTAENLRNISFSIRKDAQIQAIDEVISNRYKISIK